MPEFAITTYANYAAFASQWPDHDEQETRMLWQLLGELADDELLIQIPEWLADDKVGFIDGRTPTLFVGRVADETEKAIHFADSAAARPLMKLAHRIQNLEEGLSNAAGDPDRQDWLERRLEVTRDEFKTREEITNLQNPWLPKSQIHTAVQRA